MHTFCRSVILPTSKFAGRKDVFELLRIKFPSGQKISICIEDRVQPRDWINVMGHRHASKLSLNDLNSWGVNMQVNGRTKSRSVRRIVITVNAKVGGVLKFPLKLCCSCTQHL